MIRVRITYSRTTDFLTDVEQQVSKRGLVLRVDCAGATLGDPVHLEIATPHGLIAIHTKVLQPLPGLGVAVEVEPGEFAELILKAKHRPVAEGAPPSHDALAPDPEVPASFADVWATLTPPPPPSSASGRLPRASTAPIPWTPAPPRITPASTNPPFVARTATAPAPTVARTATSVPPTVARTLSADRLQIVERTRPKPATTGSPVLPPIVEKSRQKPTGSPMAPLKRPGTSPHDVEEPVATSPESEPRRAGTAPIDEPAAATRPGTAPIDIADGSSPDVVPPDEVAALADGSTPDAPVPAEDCDDGDDGPARQPSQAQLNAQKIQQALHGDKNQRAAILREPNKLLHNYVLRNPQIQLEEIIQIARMATASIELLTAIANRREWAEKPDVAIALVRNPKTPTPLAIKMLDHVGQAELRGLAKQQSVRDAIQRAARKKILG